MYVMMIVGEKRAGESTAYPYRVRGHAVPVASDGRPLTAGQRTTGFP